MQVNRTMARPYARAVFEQARAENAVAQWSEMLSLLAGAVQVPEVARVIRDPRVPSARLEEVLLDALGEHLSPSGRNFFRLLVARRRLSLLPLIAALYEEEREAWEGRSHVEVESAFELEPRFTQMLTGAMAKRLGREVDLSVAVNESLIGGVVIRVGDHVIDASLRGRLRELATSLV